MARRLQYFTFALIASVALQAQASSDSVTRQIPVTDEFVEGAVRTRGPERIDFRINIIVVNNVLELCGVMGISSDKRRLFDPFLRDSAFEINGREVVKDLSYWNRVDKRHLDSAVANCRSTGVKANSKIDSIGFVWSKRIYKE